MNKEFKPYEKDPMYKCNITRDEALLLQKIRDVKFGSITVHKAGNKIVRTETKASELMKDTREKRVEIAIETIIEQ